MDVCPQCSNEFDGVRCACGYSTKVGVRPGPIPVGTWLRDRRYELRRFLAAGGYGAVYAAFDHRLSRACAVKVLIGEVDEAQKELFAREATTLANLRHERIVGLWDHFTERGFHFLVEEFIEGGDLDGRTTPMDEEEAIEVGLQIADALRFIHPQGIHYLDLKPANVLRRLDGSVVLADFGIGGKFGPASPDRPAGVTPGYAPPEQSPELAGDVDVRPTHDVYAFGATMHALLTAREPLTWPAVTSTFVEFPKLASVRSDVSSDLASIVDQCLAFRREARPKDGAALYDLLSELQTRWRNAHCSSCGHRNALGTSRCSACGRVLVRPWAASARPPGPFAWKGRPPLQQVWSTWVGREVRGSPVVFDRHVWVATADDDEGFVTKVDFDGSVAERIPLGAPSRSTVVPHRGGFLIGTRSGLMSDKAPPFRGAEVFAPPTPIDDHVYFATIDGEVIALHATVGVRWRRKLKGRGIHPVAAVDSDLLVASQAGDVARLDRASGAVIWSVDAGERVFGSPLVAGDAVLVVTEGGILRIFGARDGAVRPLFHLFAAAATPAASANGWTFAGLGGQVAYRTADKPGSDHWRANLGGPIYASPAWIGDVVIVGDVSGQLALLSGSTGRELERHTLLQGLLSAPVADGNAIFLVDRGGNLTCWIGSS